MAWRSGATAAGQMMLKWGKGVGKALLCEFSHQRAPLTVIPRQTISTPLIMKPSKSQIFDIHMSCLAMAALAQGANLVEIWYRRWDYRTLYLHLCHHDDHNENGQYFCYSYCSYKE